MACKQLLVVCCSRTSEKFCYRILLTYQILKRTGRESFLTELRKPLFLRFHQYFLPYGFTNTHELQIFKYVFRRRSKHRTVLPAPRTIQKLSQKCKISVLLETGRIIPPSQYCRHTGIKIYYWLYFGRIAHLFCKVITCVISHPF